MADENQARHVLAEMQARLARSAYDALDIQGGDASPAEVRSSFLALTKKYHPARFARMSADIQRLANEVFLGIRAAHDQLARPKTSVRQTANNLPILPSKTPTSDVGRTAAPASGRIPTGPRPVVPAVSQPIPRPNAAPSSTQPIPKPVGRPLAPSGRSTPTPPTGTRTVSPPAAPAAATAPTDPALVVVYDLLERGKWEQARAALAALSALAPQVVRYRALVHYANAREAQVAGDRDTARIALLDAQDLDPDLQLAKTALAELFTRRK